MSKMVNRRSAPAIVIRRPVQKEFPLSDPLLFGSMIALITAMNRLKVMNDKKKTMNFTKPPISRNQGKMQMSKNPTEEKYLIMDSINSSLLDSSISL